MKMNMMLRLKRLSLTLLVLLVTMLSLNAMQGEELEGFLVNTRWTDGPNGSGACLFFRPEGELLLSANGREFSGDYAVEGTVISFTIKGIYSDKSYRYMKKGSYRFVAVKGEKSFIRHYRLRPVQISGDGKEVNWDLITGPHSNSYGLKGSWDGYQINSVRSSSFSLKKRALFYKRPSKSLEPYRYVDYEYDNRDSARDDFFLLLWRYPDAVCNIIGTAVLDGERWFFAYISLPGSRSFHFEVDGKEVRMRELVGWVREEHINSNTEDVELYYYHYSADISLVFRSLYDGKEYKPSWNSEDGAYYFSALPGRDYEVVTDKTDKESLVLSPKLSLSGIEGRVDVNMVKDRLLLVLDFDLPGVKISVQGAAGGSLEPPQEGELSEIKRRQFYLRKGNHTFSFRYPGYMPFTEDFKVGHVELMPGEIYKKNISLKINPVYKALLSDNLQTVKDALKEGGSLIEPIYEDLGAMSWLLRERKWELFSGLLQEYGDINRSISSSNSDSLLFRAVKDRDLEAIRFLLSKGALLHYQLENKEMISILNYVVEREDRELIDFFSSCGQSFKVPELADAIVVAARKGNLELVKTFHESGISADMAMIARNKGEEQSNRFKETALMAAVKGGHNRVVSYLLGQFALPKLKYNGAGHYENGDFFNSYELALIHKNSEALKMIEKLYDFRYQVRSKGNKNDVELELRDSPTEAESAVKGSLKRGELVRIVEFAQRESYYDSYKIWVKVEREDGSRAWCQFYKLMLY